MGQRHQAFIYCLNPANGLKEQFKSLKKYNSDKKQLEDLKLKIEKYEQAFGTKQYCVIAYHHQWLYGRSSLHAAMNIIQWNINSQKDSNPLKNQTDISGEEYLNLVTNLLSLFTTEQAKSIGRFGFEHFRMLNFFEPEMRTDCTRGDNNDGIFVVNCITDSYCFVNIGSGDSTISQLPVMVPVTAEQYVRLYYPENLSDSKTADIPATADEQEVYFKNNHRLNRLFIKSFINYKVMTQSELKKLFPDSFVKNSGDSNHIELNNQ